MDDQAGEDPVGEDPVGAAAQAGDDDLGIGRGTIVAAGGVIQDGKCHSSF